MAQLRIMGEMFGSDEIRALPHFNFQVSRIEQLHRQQRKPLIVMVAEDFDDIRMIQSRAHERFVFKLIDFIFVFAKVFRAGLSARSVLYRPTATPPKPGSSFPSESVGATETVQ